jgi:hypothetical protein
LSSDLNSPLQNLFFSKFNFSLYQGSHNGYLSKDVDLLIPHSIFIDRSLLLINIFGLIQESSLSFFNTNNILIKED